MRRINTKQQLIKDLLPINKSINKDLVGLSLREPNQDYFFHSEVEVDYIEILTENYSYNRGQDFESLVSLSENYPLIFHGLTMNIGGFDEFDFSYLDTLKELFINTRPRYITDHLCMNKHKGINTFDLLPIPHTRNMINHLKDRYNKLTDFFGDHLAFENISTYFRYNIDEMDEVDFYFELLDKTDIKILLDINNLVVNQFNHGIDPLRLIEHIDPSRVVAYHIAGYSDQGDFYFDAHDSPVPEVVWNLYSQAIQFIGPRPTTIERDENIPPVGVLLEEAKIARNIVNSYNEQRI